MANRVRRCSPFVPVIALCLITSPPVQADPAAAAAASDKINNFQQLLSLLDQDSVTHQTDQESQLVMIPTKKGPIDSVMVIRWAGNDGVVHFIQLLTLDIPEQRLAAVESAMMRLNHALPLPGLGINHDRLKPYFRLTVPIAAREGLTAGEVRSYFSYTLAEAASLQRTIDGVIREETAPEAAVAFHNQLQTGAGEFPIGRYGCELNGADWSLELREDGTVVVRQNDQPMVHSEFRSRSDRIVFTDKSGPLAVEGQGIYFWKSTDGGIKFRKHEDVSKGREMILTSAVWMRRD